MSEISIKIKTAANQNYIAAIARGLSVIRSFADQQDELTMGEIAKLLGLSRATVRRCLMTLLALGYVDTNGRYYRLTAQVLSLSKSYYTSNPLPRVVQPFIEQVSRSLSESCSVSVLINDEVIYVARSRLKRAASIHRNVGQNLPAYCTSMGRVLLANLEDSELDAYFRRVVLKKFTSETVVNETRLRNLLVRIRHREFCFIDCEFEEDLRGIAVPLRNSSGKIVASAHISTEAHRTTKDTMHSDFLPVLRKAVSQMQPFLTN
jgi:IclR family pca regulon transcriptional regulator